MGRRPADPSGAPAYGPLPDQPLNTGPCAPFRTDPVPPADPRRGPARDPCNLSRSTIDTREARARSDTLRAEMAKEGSVAPKERVNIIYKPAGNATEDVELPLKILMLGDFTGRKDDTPVEDRKPINIDKDNFNDVLKEQQVGVDLSVADRLAGEGEMAVSLKFQTMKDFTPEGIVNQVPELQKLLELRNALNALKGPLGNIPAFRKKIQSILEDVEAREKLLAELGAG